MTRTPDGVKMVRYTLISAICVVISIIVLAFTKGLLGWPALWANIFACAVATVPSYELNRKWAWGKSGKSHLWREVVPFWALAFIGLAFSTWSAVGAEALAKHRHLGHASQTVLVEIAVLMSYAVLWIGKFVIFNKVLFVHRPAEVQTASGASG
jgi:putative flippase GtrA